jgi:hypothetical protein
MAKIKNFRGQNPEASTLVRQTPYLGYLGAQGGDGPGKKLKAFGLRDRY